MTTFILLNPLQPAQFGLADDKVSEMTDLLAKRGIKTLLVDTEREFFFYARAFMLETLNDLCTDYNLGGIVAEVSGIYDQVSTLEVV
jgi:hypothetical protein